MYTNYNPANLNNERELYERNYAQYKLQKRNIKKIRQDVNRLSFAALSFYAASVILSLLIPLVLIIGKFPIDLTSDEFLQTAGLPGDLYYIFAALTTCIAVGLPYFIYMRINKLSFEDCMDTDKVKPLKAVLYTFLGFGLALSVNYPIWFLSSLFESGGYTPDRAPMYTENDLLTNIALFVATAIFPAIFEEFAFRGVVLSRLKKYGTSFSLVVSSLLFALLHVQLTSVIFAFLVGIIMGFIYLKTKNIWIPVLVHFLNNAFASIQTIIATGDETVDLIFSILMIVFVSLGVLSLIALLALRAQKEKASPTYNAPKFQSSYTNLQKYGALFSNPGFIIFMAIGLFSMLSTLSL